MESGTKLGHYEISTLLGKGGMGEVWRARDTKLGREVAIKTLPEEFAKDADRLARFEREATLSLRSTISILLPFMIWKNTYVGESEDSPGPIVTSRTAEDDGRPHFRSCWGQRARMQT